jgi:hypothetical protein
MSDIIVRNSFTDSFRIHDRESCEKAIRNGGIAALISAGVTAIFAIAGFFVTSTNTTVSYFADPALLIDVFLLLVMAFFVFRKSRTASTLLVTYFALSKIIQWFEIGPQGIFLSVIFFLYYLTAMRATYVWHSSYRNEVVADTVSA